MPQTLICPKCGSTNIAEDKSNSLANIGYFNPYKLCQGCGYSAQTFPEIDQENQKESQEKIKQTPKNLPETNVDIRYGKFEWAYLKVGAVLAVIVIIMVIIYYVFF